MISKQKEKVFAEIRRVFLAEITNLNVFSGQIQVISKKKRSSPKSDGFFWTQSQFQTFFPAKNSNFFLPKKYRRGQKRKSGGQRPPAGDAPVAWTPGHAGVHGNEVADYAAKSGSKSKIHGPEPYITVPYASCVSTVKDWSTDRWKSMWNKRKNCLRMKESVGWRSSRLTIRLLNLKRSQLNKKLQVLTGHCNLQRHKKTIGRAEST